MRQEEIGCIGTKLDDLGHHSDDGVLLDIERTGIQGPDVTEGFEFGCWESPFEESTDREGKQLDDDARHENGGICERESVLELRIQTSLTHNAG